MKVLALPLFALAGLIANVPTPTDVALSGRVTDAATGQPVRNAQVFAGSSHHAVTDRGGGYLLFLPDGWIGSEVNVTVDRVGYATANLTVRLVAGGTVLDVALGAASEVVVAPVSESEQVQRAVKLQQQWSAVADAAVVASSGSVLQGRRRGDFNTESYALIHENGFIHVANSPLSTFSIDVDRASYSNVRRFVNEGRRPPIDAVRIEEMVNYFPYDYMEPDGEHPFAITAEIAPAPWRPEHLLVRIGVQAERRDVRELPANNLVFLLDVSGSMNSSDKLPLLKTSLRMLVNELRPEDRVAIVVYAGSAGLVLPSTPGDERQKILDAIEALEAGGSTAGGAGLELAYKVAAQNHIAAGNNRVILATDGDFNVGPSSDSEMIRLIEAKREQGTFLSVLGFGTGNLKDDKMEQIADHGNGNYAYIDGVLEARKQLVTEMGGTLLTVAKDVKIQVEFNPALVAAYRLIGYENRLLDDQDFNDDTKDAGELGSGHSVTALYEVVPVGAETEVATGTIDPLRYQTVENSNKPSDAGELLFVKMRYKTPTGTESQLLDQAVYLRAGPASRDLRFASAVALFGMLLRDSEYCGDFGLDDVVELANGALGTDPHGYRREFVQIVEGTRDLALLDQASL
jgi:Ca-activated chloride channel family protein